MGYFDEEVNKDMPISIEDYKRVTNEAFLRIRGIEGIGTDSKILELVSMVYFSYKSYIENNTKDLESKYRDFLVLCYFLEEFSKQFDYITYENK